ncbi:MAG: hypothetical protein NC311_00345 [Muribaculaceae bacterium]|nr:hypothetical protein [Muribaculaceae bacterium]
MSRQIQIRRGTADEHANFTGAIGEITFDTDTKTLRVHDGTTPGGITLARTDELSISSPIPDTADYVVETQLPTADNNYTWYRKYKSGWVEQGGINKPIAYNGTTITLPVQMENTNYSVIATGASEGYGNNINTSIKHSCETNTTTHFSLGCAYSGGVNANWYVCGTYML